jgi:hypothetical protein
MNKLQSLFNNFHNGTKQERLEIFEEISDIIYHQGTVYDETLEAIPNLLNLLSHKDFELKIEVLFLLGLIYEDDDSTDLLKKIRTVFEDNLLFLRECWQKLSEETKEELSWLLSHRKGFMTMILG